MILKVNGISIIHLTLYEDYTVEREDLDGPNAGRTLDGIMHRDLLGSKRKVTVQLRPLSREQSNWLEHTILRGREWYQVTFDDFGVEAIMRAYSSKFNGVYNHITKMYHNGRLSFIEE